MAIVRKDPGEIVPRWWRRDPWWREVERWFEEPFFRLLPTRRQPYEMAWAPAIDMVEKKDSYVVTADLPGVKKEDIKISVKEDILTIQGERKVEEEVKEANYYCCERSYGAFHRSIELPSSVKEKEVKAEFKDGMLHINLPKEEKPTEKAITIEVK